MLPVRSQYLFHVSSPDSTFPVLFWHSEADTQLALTEFRRDHDKAAPEPFEGAINTSSMHAGQVELHHSADHGLMYTGMFVWM